MKMMFMGFPVEAWDDIYRIFIHVKERPAKDVYEVHSFWENLTRETPMDCLKIASWLSASREISADDMRDMIEKIIREFK